MGLNSRGHPKRFSSLILFIKQASASCINLHPCFNVAGFMLASFFHLYHTLPRVFISNILRLHLKKVIQSSANVVAREEGTLLCSNAARAQMKAATFMISSLRIHNFKYRKFHFNTRKKHYYCDSG